jgi:glycosyltransferase involved in cell wall biosynthesis
VLARASGANYPPPYACNRRRLVKIAIVHDWLTLTGGAERVLAELLDLFPDADFFTLVCFLGGEEKKHILGDRQVNTSFLQNMWGVRKHYRSYLPLMPIAIEQFDLSQYDLVLSSSYAVAKGVITGPDQVHIAYTYSPIRYAWDMQHTYLRESNLKRGLKAHFARLVLHYIRMWDTRTANGVDVFIAISEFIGRRIRKAYGRDSKVIYPPVDTNRFTVSEEDDGYYLTASRLVPYKRIPLIAEAFRGMPDRKLIVIGDGPDMPALQAQAGPNIEILGRQSDAAINDYMRRAKAFVFAAEEDFGIVPLEAQACGKPVIAYGRGGSLETIRGFDCAGQTGVFFDTQSVGAIQAAVRHFETRAHAISPAVCRANAERFSTDRFRREIRELVDRTMHSRPCTKAVEDGA